MIKCKLRIIVSPYTTHRFRSKLKMRDIDDPCDVYLKYDFEYAIGESMSTYMLKPMTMPHTPDVAKMC